MIEKTGQITLADISKAAGVSLNTAAKVMAGQAKKARISDKTAKKVKKIAKELGYVPNIMARNLRSQNNRIIGVCIADMTESAYVLNSHVILQELHNRNFYPILTVAEVGLDLCRKNWFQNKIEGLILCGTTQEMDTKFFSEIKKQGITTIIAGCTFRDPNTTMELPEVSTVSMDNSTGMILAINHLLKQNRKRIAHITGPDWHADAYEREAAYIKTIQRHHNPITVNMEPDQIHWKGGYYAAQKLMQNHPDIDAIIAYDDQVALGAMKWLIENNIKIPSQIAIIGFDDSPAAELSTPSLTSIAQPLEAIGKKSVDLLESSINSKSPIEKIQITPNLIPRNSDKA